MENIELKRLWEQIKGEIVRELPDCALPWVEPLEITGFDNGVLSVVTGQLMGRDILRRNYYSQIVEIIKKVTNNPNSDFVIIYDEKATKSIKKENEKIQKKIVETALKEQAMENLSYMQSASNLNLKYKFENYVVGKNNEFAYKVAKSVAEYPAEKYNPLFIYGKSGLGKTHLMQAIGHYTLFKNSKFKVKYTKTEDYVNDFISNSRKGKDTIENMSKFYKKYSNIDIILIDDIQFIESKNKTMLQMQHTFDSLYNKGKQIVITSDRLPKDIPTLTSALCTRFEMGLMVELVTPEYQNRFDILKKLSEDSGLKYTDDALEYIANNYVNNVRELEGAFHKAAAFAEINATDLTLDVVKTVLKCSENTAKNTFEDIVGVTAKFYEVSPEDIKGTARGQKVANARHMSIYLSRELTGKSFVSIAEYFNKKHTTIMYSYEKINKELRTNNELGNAEREIRQALRLI
ncbi:MAG: chromosomal replication initiator protein DnaA [bacterium]|nr:chromosomal replication initiator protein DnaA [bacterium]